MSYSDLLNRMMDKDTDAFLELTDRYGWALYSAIRSKHSNKEVADRIYNETMNRFYHCLQNPESDDPVEAILCAFAEQISHDAVMAHGGNSQNEENVPPRIHLEPAESAYSNVKIKKKVSIWLILGMAVVLAGIIASMWLIAGLLMEMQVIPFVDFGYSWFYVTMEEILSHFS